MSYQLKSTPFFQRIVRTSKKNGQLQKLKEEYERIKDFNERTIDIKMRQVRLKRLFKEIEEIKETNMTKRRLDKEKTLKGQMPFYREDLSKPDKNRRRGHQRRSSPDQSKTMNLIRSEGGLSPIKGPKLTSPSRKAQTDEGEEKNKERVIRRLNYGNRVSSWNMQHMLTNNLTGAVNVGLRETLRETRRFLSKPFMRNDSVLTSDVINKSRNEKVKHRINYGVSPNSVSKASRRRKNNVAADDMPIVPDKKLKNSNTLQRPKMENNLNIQSPVETRNLKNSEAIYSCLSSNIPSEENENRSVARKRWNKIAGVIRSSFDINKSNRNLQTLEKCCKNLEYQLRTISNDTHLPQSQIMVQQDERLNLSENDEGSIIDDEILLNEVNLYEDVLSDTASATSKMEYTPPPPPPPPEPFQLNFHQRYGNMCFQKNNQAVFNYNRISKHFNAPPPPPEPLPFNFYHDFRKPYFKQNSQTICNKSRIPKLLKSYPPIPDPSPVVEKQQSSTFGVQKLCEIFEHKPSSPI